MKRTFKNGILILLVTLLLLASVSGCESPPDTAKPSAPSTPSASASPTAVTPSPEKTVTPAPVPLPATEPEAPPPAEETITPPKEVTPPEETVGPDLVEVTYFHRPARCSGCRYAEAATTYTMDTYFADEMADGKIVLQVFNLGDEANTAVIERYGASTSSLFINSITDGIDDIEEVKEIWFLLGKDDEFTACVQEKIEAHLNGAS